MAVPTRGRFDMSSRNFGTMTRSAPVDDRDVCCVIVVIATSGDSYTLKGHHSLLEVCDWSVSPTCRDAKHCRSGTVTYGKCGNCRSARHVVTRNIIVLTHDLRHLWGRRSAAESVVAMLLLGFLFLLQLLSFHPFDPVTPIPEGAFFPSFLRFSFPCPLRSPSPSGVFLLVHVGVCVEVVPGVVCAARV